MKIEPKNIAHFHPCHSFMQNKDTVTSVLVHTGHFRWEVNL